MRLTALATGSTSEWLAGVMAEMRRRAGDPPKDETWVASHLERRINGFQETPRVEEALRTVIVASPDAVTGGHAAPSVAQG